MKSYLEETSATLRSLADNPEFLRSVQDAVDMICASAEAGHPLLVCGNGGSASDAMHITGELVGKFNLERPAFNAICLSSNPVVLTAWSNDVSFDSVFARQVEAYGRAGSVIWGLSTSGNSRNLVEAFTVARRLGIRTLGMTGESGGALRNLSDCLISVPASGAASVQNLHLPTYHWMCSEIESRWRAFAQGC